MLKADLLSSRSRNKARATEAVFQQQGQLLQSFVRGRIDAHEFGVEMGWKVEAEGRSIDFDGLEAGGRGRPTLSWVVRGLGRSEESVDVKESSARRGELDCLLSSAVTVKTEGKEPRRSF